MTINLEEARADLQMRQVPTETIDGLLARLRADDGLFIVCPHCGRRRNFSHLPAVVSDWENLITVLERVWCERCVRADLLKNLTVVCLLTRMPGEAENQEEEVTHYGFRASSRRKRRY